MPLISHRLKFSTVALCENAVHVLAKTVHGPLLFSSIIAVAGDEARLHAAVFGFVLVEVDIVHASRLHHAENNVAGLDVAVAAVEDAVNKNMYPHPERRAPAMNRRVWIARGCRNIKHRFMLRNCRTSLS